MGMMIPFEVVGCSWPRPVEQVDGRWASEPEWGTPLMPVRPLPYSETIDGEPCWTINWREFFQTGTKPYHHTLGGEMRGFHVVFYLRVEESGKLFFWSDGGCVIGRNGRIAHSDLSAPTRRPTARSMSSGEIGCRWPNGKASASGRGTRS